MGPIWVPPPPTAWGQKAGKFSETVQKFPKRYRNVPKQYSMYAIPHNFSHKSVYDNKINIISNPEFQINSERQ
jgi:hypothetical protein